MAPEQLSVQTRYYSMASDVWAFGVVCYEVRVCVCAVSYGDLCDGVL
jgi:serine/threonine protein kinase